MWRMTDGGLRARLLWQADNGAGDQGSPPPQDDAPAQGAGDQPELVDVNATDEHGHRLWFSREAMREVREEAANYRTLYQEARQALEALSGQGSAGAQTPTDSQDGAGGGSNDTQDVLQRLAALEARERDLKLDNAILAEAARQRDDRARFIDPSDALRLVDRAKVTIKDDGTVDVESVAAALADLARAKPHLLESKRTPRLDASNPGEAARTPRIVEELKARAMGAGRTFGGGGVIVNED